MILVLGLAADLFCRPIANLQRKLRYGNEKGGVRLPFFVNNFRYETVTTERFFFDTKNHYLSLKLTFGFRDDLNEKVNAIETL